MSKNISLSSAKAYPCFTPFSSRFGGLRPSFLKNRAQYAATGTKRGALSAVTGASVSSSSSAHTSAASLEEDISNLAGVSVDVALGRIRPSPHCTFSYPTTHMQLMVRYPHPNTVVRKFMDEGASLSLSSAAVGASSDHPSPDDDAALTSLPQSSIAAAIGQFSANALGRFAKAQADKKAREEAAAMEREAARQLLLQRMGSGTANACGGGDGGSGGEEATAQRQPTTRKRKQSASSLPYEALQLLADTTECELFSKRINAWSLYAKAVRAYREKGDCLAVVLPADSRVLPAAEAIATQLPHRFQWLPMEVPWLAAGPLAPDSPFRSPMHANKPFMAAMGHGGGGSGEGVVSDAKGATSGDAISQSTQQEHNQQQSPLPQQPVQLRALVPIVDPPTEVGLDMEAVLANPIAASIYGMVFEAQVMGGMHMGGAMAAPPLPSIASVNCRIRDNLLMPLIKRAADDGTKASSLPDSGPVKGIRRAVIRKAGAGSSSTRAKDATTCHHYEWIIVDKRQLAKAVGWHHFGRLLGGIEQAVDGHAVRLV